MSDNSDPRATPEKRLVVYSAAEEKYCAGLLDGFRARHPGIEIDFVFGISVALHERYRAALAAGKPEADLLWSSAMDLQMGLVLAGDALPHPSPEARALPQGAAYRDLAYATTVEPLVTLVNRELFDVKLVAGSLTELTAALRSDPQRFLGRIASYDIAANGLGFLALLHESRRSEEFTAFLQALAACKPRLFGSNPPLVEEVASGRAALGFHVLASYAQRATRLHPSLAIAASNTPPLAVSRVAFIPRSAPHPEAARLFLDYLLSRDGQQRLLEAGLFPIRRLADGATDSKADAVTPIRIDRDFDDLLDPQRRDKLLSRWRAAVAAPHAK
jgi:iron(III) transport system substrate-binding protein